MKVEEVLGEEGLVAGGAVEPLPRVRPAVGLVSNLLEEFFATLLTLVLLEPGVQQRVSLQTGGVGEGLRALLTDVRPQGALSVVVEMGGEVSGEHFLLTDRTGGFI